MRCNFSVADSFTATIVLLGNTKDWRKLSPRVEVHERSPALERCFGKWKELSIALRMGATINAELQKQHDMEMRKWEDILR